MPICFVIMGYGIKTDYTTGRELDLDKTYNNIIKPVVIECGYDCIRADEIRHSGLIDLPMYTYLYESDIVIADLSTYNPNAFYELGIRHGIKPYTTIAIAEKELKYPFDINHTIIMKYEHLGKDIGYEEVLRFRQELKKTIESVKECKVDSPLYTFLHGLIPPRAIENVKTEDQKIPAISLSTIITGAIEAMDAKDFIRAKELFRQAGLIDKNNDYLIQKLALATYKAESPTPEIALDEALKVLGQLNPEYTNDPETLGLTGAIYKRKYQLTGEIEYLGKSIKYYEKGFYLKNDYYNGINFAYLLNLRGLTSTNENDFITDYTLASRIRRKVVDICDSLITSDFSNRSDQYWILATLEEAYFGLGDMRKYQFYKDQAIELKVSNWQYETTEEQIANLKNMLAKTGV